MTPADLRAARYLLGLSQRVLAKELGVAQATLSRWETGKHKIEHGRMLSLALYQLADTLGVRSIPPDDWEDPEF